MVIRDTVRIFGDYAVSLDAFDLVVEGGAIRELSVVGGLASQKDVVQFIFLAVVEVGRLWSVGCFVSDMKTSRPRLRLNGLIFLSCFLAGLDGTATAAPHFRSIRSR